MAATLEALGAAQDLAGETVLITAGPTREPVDPVRYLGNRSSGKMGYALAEAVLRRGARVILVSGPTNLQPPGAAEMIPVETADEMRQAVLARFPETSVVIKAAAVADYRPKEAAGQKIKRREKLVLELEPTADILAELGRKKTTQILVGFAAETEDALQNAKQKLKSKSADAMVVNDVSRPGIGFDSERNAVTIVTPTETVEVLETSKWEVAHRVLDAVVRIRQERSQPAAPMSSGRPKA